MSFLTNTCHVFYLNKENIEMRKSDGFNEPKEKRMGLGESIRILMVH
jgi:hypothetical protein